MYAVPVRRALVVLMLAGATGCDEGSITGKLLDAAPREDAASREDDAGAEDPDAAPGDPDAGPPTGLITVRVTMGGVPLEGTPVMFHTAGGVHLDEQLTDAEGQAIGQVSDGGQVTTFLPRTPETLFTVTGVAPGDIVNIDGPRTGGAGTLAVSSTTNAAGATSYFAETCTTEHMLPDVKVPTSVALPAACVDAGGTFDLLVRATSAGTTVAYRHALDVTPDVDMSTDVVVGAPWRKDLDPATISITEAPAFATEAFGRARAVRSERPFFLGDDTAALEAGSASLSVEVPATFAERVVLSAAVGGGDEISSVTRALAAPGALAVTGADFLAPPLAVDVGSAGGRILVTWDDEAPSADLQVAVLGYDTSEGLRHWVAVSAPGAHSVLLPELESPLANLAPGPGDVVFANVGAVETTLLEGYGEARTLRPGLALQAFDGFVAGELDYTLRLAYRGITP